MNILFLTITRFTTIAERGIYTDLMRFFADQDHKVCVVAPAERRYRKPTSLVNEGQVSILNVTIPNIQKTNLLEKGLSTLLLERLFLKAIKNHFSHIRFDLVIYSTPPITFTKIIREIKERNNAKAYLLLKDIFPQNAIDLQMLKQGGLIHRFFYRKELALYRVSDYIGCMSPANVAFLLKHNSWLDPARIEVNPNSTALLPSTLDQIPKNTIRESHQLPTDKTIFVYGGNLGKPQGISFLLQTIEACAAQRSLFPCGRFWHRIPPHAALVRYPQARQRPPDRNHAKRRLRQTCQCLRCWSHLLRPPLHHTQLPLAPAVLPREQHACHYRHRSQYRYRYYRRRKWLWPKMLVRRHRNNEATHSILLRKR